jgi:hypothetical protein
LLKEPYFAEAKVEIREDGDAPTVGGVAVRSGRDRRRKVTVLGVVLVERDSNLAEVLQPRRLVPSDELESRDVPSQESQSLIADARVAQSQIENLLLCCQASEEGDSRIGQVLVIEFQPDELAKICQVRKLGVPQAVSLEEKLRERQPV